MRLRPSPCFFTLLLLACASTAALLAGGCDDDRAPSRGSTLELALENREVAPWRSALVDIAYAAVSAMPLNPHVKNRSRAQEAVVDAALELGQPITALSQIKGITNWRRGNAYAKLAYWCASHGHTEGLAPFMKRARNISAQESQSQDSQAWRVDRIRVNLARVHHVLGNAAEARRLQSGTVESESSRFSATQAGTFSKDQFADQIAAIDAVLSTGSFDAIPGALETAVVLFDRFYDDTALRDQAEKRIVEGYAELPVMVRVGFMTRIAEHATEHSDLAKAKALVDATRKIIDGQVWLAEHYLPMVARLAAVRHRAEDEARARREAIDALARFKAERHTIANVFRGKALRPLAEAWQSMGSTDEALKIYAIALEAGFENPNGRPRAIDLAETCCSMARAGVQPTDAMMERIREIRDALGNPW